MATPIDNRGTIKDLLVGKDYSVTHITFKENAVRGNHYHKKTTQQDIVLKGKLVLSENGHETIVNKGDHIFIDAEVRHAYRALEPSEIVSICFGVRVGGNYEKDTFRLIGKDKLL